MGVCGRIFGRKKIAGCSVADDGLSGKKQADRFVGMARKTCRQNIGKLNS